MEETAKWLEDHIQNICHLFTVEDLKYLQRGGRISKTTALVGTMIGIKPVLHVDPEGKLVSISKVRGRKQSIQALVNKMEENIGNIAMKSSQFSSAMVTASKMRTIWQSWSKSVLAMMSS